MNCHEVGGKWRHTNAMAIRSKEMRAWELNYDVSTVEDLLPDKFGVNIEYWGY